MRVSNRVNCVSVMKHGTESISTLLRKSYFCVSLAKEVHARFPFAQMDVIFHLLSKINFSNKGFEKGWQHRSSAF